MLSLKSFGNLWGNSYKPCLFLRIAIRFTCGNSKYYGQDCSVRLIGSKKVMKFTKSVEISSVVKSRDVIRFARFGTIFYHLKNVKITHGGVILLRLKPSTLLNVTLLHGCFPHFLYCSSGTKSCKASNIRVPFLGRNAFFSLGFMFFKIKCSVSQLTRLAKLPHIQMQMERWRKRQKIYFLWKNDS